MGDYVYSNQIDNHTSIDIFKEKIEYFYKNT